MLRYAAVVLGSLAIAAPAAAINGGNGTASLSISNLVTAAAATKSDRSRSCQAGERSTKKSGMVGDRHRHAVVACEQPPRSQFVTPDSIAKATVAALSVLG